MSSKISCCGLYETREMCIHELEIIYRPFVKYNSLNLTFRMFHTGDIFYNHTQLNLTLKIYSRNYTKREKITLTNPNDTCSSIQSISSQLHPNKSINTFPHNTGFNVPQSCLPHSRRSINLCYSPSRHSSTKPLVIQNRLKGAILQNSIKIP